MHLVVVLVAVALLGLAALVAVGRFGQMQAEPVRDQYQPPVDPDRVRAEDLDGIRFGISPMGYDMAQVDDLMARLARELDTREAEANERRMPSPGSPGVEPWEVTEGGAGSPPWAPPAQ